MEQSTKILFEDILLNSKFCTLATASLNGKPEAATIHYCVDKDYNIYFNSFPHYRKYQNIRSNPQASIVITQNLNTIQMDGDVTELTGSSTKFAKQLLLKKFPEDAKYLSDSTGLFFKFNPAWIRILVDNGVLFEHVMIMDKSSGNIA